MGVYIKGMKMPRSCFECKLDLRTDICQAFCEWNAEHPYSIRATNRLPDCPLVEVQEPHGRLIDEDNVIDAIYERLHTLQTHKEFIRKYGDIDLLGILPYIAKISTVIGAEVSDDTGRSD